jgi:iron complex outermembrane recepter protein
MNMRKFTAILTSLLLMTAVSGFGQGPDNLSKGQIKGLVRDASQLPLEKAAVILLRAGDSSTLHSTLTGKDGSFAFHDLSTGTYRVEVSAMGYQTLLSSAIVVTSELPVADLGDLKPSVQPKELKSVVVSARKPFIEQKIDRTIVNVDAAVTNSGATVLEVLEKSPGVSVDKDGNISLKGKQQVLVMIDGRPTYLGPNELASMLKNMPASSAEQIEIMTNPSAKYDAAGNSGIINIRTKKNRQVGLNGSLSLNYGQGVYAKTNNSLNLNYRTGKFNFFGNAGYSHWNGFQNLDIHRTFYTNAHDVDAVFEQTSRMRNYSDNYTWKAGMDYYLSKKTTIGVVTTGFVNPETFTSDSKSYLQDPHGVTDSIVLANSWNGNQWTNYTANLNLRHQFDSTGREFTADFDWAKYDNASTMNFTNQVYLPSGSLKSTEKLRGNLPVGIDIISAKADYAQPFWKGGKLETGVKGSHVETDNAAYYFNITESGEQPDNRKTNRFRYKENIYAAYVNLNKQFGKLGVQAGLRYEYTQMNGNQFGNPSRPDSSFQRGFGNLFPTAYLTYQAGKNNQWGLNYGKRIDRPAYQDLNPFLFFIDNYTYQAGNPYIRPQYTHNIEFSHTYKGFLTTTLNYGFTKDYQTETFEQAQNPDGTTGYATIVRQGNIGHRINYGVAVSAQVPVKKWWTAILYTNVSHNQFTGNVNGYPVDVAATHVLFNVNNQFHFDKGWSAELSGWYRTKGVDGQFIINPLGQMSLGLAKQVLKGKGTLKLNVRDVLYTGTVSGAFHVQNMAASFTNARDSRVANLTFTWRFGKPAKTQQRQTGGAGDEQGRVKLNNNN